jgi:hypothetical protein
MPTNLMIEVTGNLNKSVKRRYLNPTDYEYWLQFKTICENQVFLDLMKLAWLEVLPKEFDSYFHKNDFNKTLNPKGGIKSALEKTRLPVDWHLDYIFHEYLKTLKKGDKIIVKNNAFRDYHATEIITSDRKKLYCPPFFEPLRIENANNELIQIMRMRRGFQDTHLFLAKPISSVFEKIVDPNDPTELNDPDFKKKIIDTLIRLFSWFEVELEITLFSRSRSGNTLILDVAIQEWAYDKIKAGLNWEDACKNSIQHKIWSFPGFEGILLSSPHVRNCVERLSIAWHNIDLRKLLILAPPGSGKEKLIDLFISARMTPLNSGGTNNWRGVIIATELKDSKNLEESLTAIEPNLDKPPIDIKDKWERPMLFMDEIHQATKEERASMLRILESDKIVISSKVLKLKQLVWLFAASETKEEVLTKREPPDFWTRMDQIIEMKHPLDFLDAEVPLDTRIRVLADYFWLYWAIDNQEQGVVRQKILNDLLSYEAFPIASKFADSVGSPLMNLFSVRYIRGMARRLKGKAVLFGLQSRPYKKEEFLKKITDEFVKDWTIEAFMDMVMTKQKGK